MTRTQSRRELRALAKQVGADFGELLDRVTQTRGVRSDFSAYADDPIAFFEEVLHVTDPPLTDAQVEMCEAVCEHDFVAVVSAQGVGKTFAAAGLIWFAVMVWGATVVVTATTTRHVKNVLFRQNLRKFFLAAKFPGDLFEMAYRGPGPGTILGLVPGDVDKITGVHAHDLLLVVDEFQGAEEFLLEGAMACLTGSENNRLLLLGNPIHAGGSFEAVTRNPDCHTLWIDGLTHPNVIHNEERYGGAITRKFVARIKRQFGGDKSPQYVSRVRGRFPTSTDEYSLISSVEMLERAYARWEREHPYDHHTNRRGLPPGRYAYCHDPARGGASQSVTAVWKGNVLLRFEAWRRDDTMQSCGLLQKLFALRGAEVNLASYQVDGRSLGGVGHLQSYDVCVDLPGLGASTVDRLRELNYRVNAFEGGKVADDPQRFNNRRTECYWALRDALEKGTIALPRHLQLQEELMAVRWHEDSSGRTALESKDRLVHRIGRSPDYADACVLRFSTLNESSGLCADVNW